MNDVCIVLEGSYPYVTGGVSAWLDRLMRGLPELSFAVAHAQEGERPTGCEAVYSPPPNLHCLAPLALDPERGLSGEGTAGTLPAARIYHALCSGAPAALAERAARRRGGAFVLTEHGLAWHEAALGISGCKPNRVPSRPAPAQMRARARALADSARRAYGTADLVTSVCAVNVSAQIAAGAPRSRCALIPNAAPSEANAAPLGIAVSARHSRAAEERRRTSAGSTRSRSGEQGFRVALVGRVVPVKDVMCFLRAGALLAAQRPGCELLVVGPLEHDREYAHACARLARELEIDSQVCFTGERDVRDLYRELDAVALCSVSEAQPLVLLEAMAAGVPVVATAIGGCPELVRGAGLLVPPGDHVALARALLALGRDQTLARRLSAAGAARVRAAHSPRAVYRRYRELYERAVDIGAEDGWRKR